MARKYSILDIAKVRYCDELDLAECLQRVKSGPPAKEGSSSPEAGIAADAKWAMAENLMATAVDVALAARGHGGRTHNRHVTEAERVRLSPW